MSRVLTQVLGLVLLFTLSACQPDLTQHQNLAIRSFKILRDMGKIDNQGFKELPGQPYHNRPDYSLDEELFLDAQYRNFVSSLDHKGFTVTQLLPLAPCESLRWLCHSRPLVTMPTRSGTNGADLILDVELIVYIDQNQEEFNLLTKDRLESSHWEAYVRDTRLSELITELTIHSHFPDGRKGPSYFFSAKKDSRDVHVALSDVLQFRWAGHEWTNSVLEHLYENMERGISAH